MKNKLPNATAVLVLGILSVPTCLCFGILGLVLGIVALVLAKKDQKLYEADPELYDNYGYITTGRIFAIIGLILSTIYFAFYLFLSTMSQEELRSFQENLQIKYEKQLEENE